jgi:hypothetical protein
MNRRNENEGDENLMEIRPQEWPNVPEPVVKTLLMIVNEFREQTSKIKANNAFIEELRNKQK